MATATATTRKTKKKPEEVLTFGELNTRKLREKIEAYRGRVAQAADGELVDEKGLEEVSEALAYLQLPEMCWERDIRALNEYRQAGAAAEEIQAKQPQLDAEAGELQTKIAAMKKELGECEARLNYCAKVAPLVQAEQLRRQNELKTLHPHLLLGLEQAVALRAEARQKAQAKQVPAKTLEGWSN